MSASRQGAPPAGDAEHFVYGPDPDTPGWLTWDVRDQDRFTALLGPLRVRAEGDREARLRMIPRPIHRNLADGLHGGAMMALIDVALFATCRVFDLFDVGRASTVDLSVQFIGPARTDRPLDIVTEILRETGRLVFLRGLAVQDDGDASLCAAFSGTVRKPPRDR
ncbi:PaaI family thioesterase [bacterium]|nr:MAG: PaaI family thioesterase [bacterium]